MKNIKQLIIAADTLLKTNVDVDAFRSWEKSSLLALVALLGPLHYYTENFGLFTREKKPSGPAGWNGDSDSGPRTICLEADSTQKRTMVSTNGRRWRTGSNLISSNW